MASQKNSVLFVCTGNICRSPAADAIFQKFASEAGLDIAVDSAGTHGYHTGEFADDRMIAALKKRGYPSTHKARPVTAKDLEKFTWILAMDQGHFQFLRNLDPSGKFHSKIKMMLEFHPEFKNGDVPDPYYGKNSGFDHVIDLLETACKNFLETLKK